MPVLRHAKKKLRQDKKRTEANKKIKQTYKDVVKKASAIKTPAALEEAYSAIDKAAKQNILHKNKAAHMKSALSKAVSSGKAVTQPATQKAKKAETKAKPATKKTTTAKKKKS